MYLPKDFQESRPDILHQLIQDRAFGTLVTWGHSGMEANHLPFVLVKDAGALGTLCCHVARANPVWRQTDVRTEVLVIFPGPDAYVSPNWYPQKAKTGRAVPTWNYVVVHAYGSMRTVEDPAWLRAHLEALTRHHESGRSPSWQISEAPEDYLQRMIGAVMGIEIPVTRLLGKRKLSQNRSARDRMGVARGLRGEATEAARHLADLMS